MAGNPNGKLMNLLRSVNRTPNDSHHLNPRQTRFLNAPQNKLDSQGNFLDPWGHQYEITLGTDLDGGCEHLGGGYGSVLNRKFEVWSRGPDGEPKKKDDIVSWR